MEVNDLGQVSGKPQGKKFFMQDKSLIKPDGTKLSNEKRLELMSKDAGIRTTEEYQKEIDDIIQYNENLKKIFNVPIKLNGNTILVRLYKHQTTKRIGDMFVPNRLVIPYQTEGGKIAHQDSPLQFTNRAVVYMISPNTSESFRKVFKEGDIVDLRFGINLMQQRTWMTPESYDNDQFENWFIINENMIEKGIVE